MDRYIKPGVYANIEREVRNTTNNFVGQPMTEETIHNIQSSIERTLSNMNVSSSEGIDLSYVQPSGIMLNQLQELYEYSRDVSISHDDIGLSNFQKMVTITENEYAKLKDNEKKIKELEAKIDELTKKLYGINIFNNI